MGIVRPLNPQAKTGSFWDHRVLRELAEELENYYRDPASFKPDRLKELAVTFAEELMEVLGRGTILEQIKSEFQTKAPTAWSILRKALKVIPSGEVDDFGLDRRFELAIKPFFDFLFTQYFRVEVKGVENIPTAGRALLVSNHSGVLPYDAAMMKVGIFNEHSAQRELRFLVDDFVFHFPFLGILMNRIGGVRACPENAERLLNSDELIVVFPEGIKGIGKNFKDRYQLQRFGRGGVIRLAYKTRSPIIPCAVVGAEEIHPLLWKSTRLARPLGLPFIPVTPTFPWLGPLGAIPLPTKWSIHFGAPLSYDHISARDLNEGITVSRETEKLRVVIQEMIKEALKERRSVFMG